MVISRRSLIHLEMPYAARVVRIAGVDRVLFSTEGYGPVFLASPPDWKPVRICNGPGGVMAFSRAVGTADAVFAIMGCFPGFKFHGAGIYRLAPGKGLSEPWNQERVLDLPFAHRLEVLRCGGTDLLVAASLAETKDSPQDWSRPGSVYACRISADAAGQKWALKPVFGDLFRNHGFLVIGEDSDPRVLVSGTEGIFQLDVALESGSPWKSDTWLPREVSELALIDLDADGQEEMVTIEGFHGDFLKLYKRQGRQWNEIHSHGITSGHGLWAGRIGGLPAFLCGSRAGDKALRLFLSRREGRISLDEIIVDEEVAPANVAVVASGAEELIFTTNKQTNEVAVYRLTI